MNTFLIIISIVLVIFLIVIILITRKKDNYEPTKYNGICLFDIDGTLTTGKYNEEVVQMCLDNNYAVGISTAGSIYTPQNIKNFSWMPKNLYSFMQKHNFDTFNNVGSGILMGKKQTEKYIENDLKAPAHLSYYEIYGWRKGFSLQETASKYGITDSTKMVLFDDMTSFLYGMAIFNDKFKLICSGSDCNGQLTTENMRHIFTV